MSYQGYYDCTSRDWHSKMTSHQNMRKVVEQLKTEADVKPLLVSQAAQSLRDYCEKHFSSDMLLTGVSPTGENPYKDKAKCSLL